MWVHYFRFMDKSLLYVLYVGLSNHGDRWESERSDPRSEAKDLTRSKWSDDLDDENINTKEPENVDCNALSGLMQAYGKGDRCVRWADQVRKFDLEHSFDTV